MKLILNNQIVAFQSLPKKLTDEINDVANEGLWWHWEECVGE